MGSPDMCGITLQKMTSCIEDYRTLKLSQVTRYPLHLHHRARLRCLANMSRKAAQLSPELQQLIEEAAEASQTIVHQNPGYPTLEASRLQTTPQPAPSHKCAMLHCTAQFASAHTSNLMFIWPELS
jgi:hypothetical protein